MEGVHRGKENAAGLAKLDGGGVELAFEAGGETFERLLGASKDLLGGCKVAEVASEGVDLHVDAGQISRGWPDEGTIAEQGVV